MATLEINDGTGKGFRAAVDSDNRLLVEAVTLEHIAHEAIDSEDAYVLSSGFVSLTNTASFNGIMFIKGLDETKHFHIERIRICSNGASGQSLQVKVIANATTGTLISDANAAYSHNTVLGSSNTLTNVMSVFSASGDSKTITNGDWFAQYQQPLLGHSNQDYMGSIIVAKDTSLAVLAKPSAACDICVEILGYLEPEH